MAKKILIAALVVVGIVAGLGGCSGGRESDPPALWPERGISELLPKPEFGTLDYVVDSGDSFVADLADVARSDFEGYLQACKDAGFTVDAEESGDVYDAYSSDGHALRLVYSDLSDGSLSIGLDAPIEMSSLAWPTNAPGALAPVPPSLVGKVSHDNAETYAVYIGQMGPDEYAAYVDACLSAGFNVDHSRSEDSFTAQDATGNSISVRYERFETVYVSVSVAETSPTNAAPSNAGSSEAAPQGQASEVASQASATESTAGESAGGVTPEFKRMMDEYEAFFDEYVAFVRSYDPNAASVESMARYSSLMTQYAETMAAMEAVDQEQLTEADAVYYAQVTARIYSKLTEVA